jgi:mRNA interferase MazF
VRVRQGDVYWVDFGEPSGSRPGYTHPAVVIQSDTFNKSAIDTVVVCEVTETLRLGKARGNVALVPGEANLPMQSVVNVSQIFTVNKTDLRDWIGRLDAFRVREVLDGLHLLLEGDDSS